MFTKKNCDSFDKLKGGIAAVTIRGFLLQALRRDPIVPLAAKVGMSTWSDTQKIDRDCDGRHIKSDTTDITSREISHDPPYALAFLIKLEHLVGQENGGI